MTGVWLGPMKYDVLNKRILLIWMIAKEMKFFDLAAWFDVQFCGKPLNIFEAAESTVSRSPICIDPPASWYQRELVVADWFDWCDGVLICFSDWNGFEMLPFSRPSTFERLEFWWTQQRQIHARHLHVNGDQHKTCVNDLVLAVQQLQKHMVARARGYRESRGSRLIVSTYQLAQLRA